MNGDDRQRLSVTIRGAVQGVGFRPFVYRLATELHLTGWVNNSSQGVFIEVEGPPERLREFLVRIEPEKPPPAVIHSLEPIFLDPVGYDSFEIRASDPGGTKTTLILPDLATCDACIRELFDPADRRFRYPFINCTHCGPRFSIIRALPYDRPNTTMAGFILCDACRAEYENPLDRRFHAQPNACPVCGPRLELRDRTGKVVEGDPLLVAVEAIRDGRIVAVKGLGGFHLLVDARSEESVRLLRARKRREEKPFALMYPSLARVAEDCFVSPLEERLLRSPEAPIVLLRARKRDAVAPAVAPNTPDFGVMLPYTPLHHLLMAELGFPVVATSGNLSDDPLCTDENEAVARLGDIADLFLVHNRPIARHVDDSIVRVLQDREMVLRRARGYAPLPIPLPSPVPSVLAVGAHQKNAIALTVDRQVFVSQHIGDLETAPALAAFRRVIDDFETLYDCRPETVACDLHPDYLSTAWANRSGRKVVRVQHHHAHVLACRAENRIEGPVLGVSWDGTGYGPDGTIWGGEILHLPGEGPSFTRVAHLRRFSLPGGARAVREPRRCAIGLLYEIWGDDLWDRDDLAPVCAFAPKERSVLRGMLRAGINSPVTTSAGRLFDGVAALLDLRQEARFEGQAAMALEFAADGQVTSAAYPIALMDTDPITLDWEPTVREIIDGLRRGRAREEIAARFHNALVEGIVLVARRVREPQVALTGGCFQNRRLTERAIVRLREEGFRPFWHQRIPPNDGGIALGQAIAACNRLRSRETPAAADDRTESKELP